MWVKNYCWLCLLICSCSTSAVFYSPNHFKNTKGVVLLSGGDSVKGYISMNMEVMVHPKLSVRNKDKQDEKIFLHDVSAIKIASDTYELRHIGKGGPGRNLYFMKRLTTPDSKIHLFEHLEKRGNHRSDKRADYQVKYYIQFANQPRYSVWPVSGSHFQPHFDNKLGELLQDCPALAEKVLKKDQGYFYRGFNTTEKDKLKVWLRIIKEYNECPRQISNY